MLQKLFLLFLVLFVSTASAWSITPVGPNDPARPDGTVIKKLNASSTFVYDELSTTGAAPVTLIESISGTTVLATGSVISLPAGTKATLSTYIPSAAQGFEISIWGDEGVVNNPTNLATGTFSCGWRISSGTSRIWAGAPGTQVLATRNGLVATFSIVAW